jgi:hypothetical protein
MLKFEQNSFFENLKFSSQIFNARDFEGTGGYQRNFDFL